MNLKEYLEKDSKIDRLTPKEVEAILNYLLIIFKNQNKKEEGNKYGII